MKLTKQQYIFSFLTLIAILLGMYITVVGTNAEVACYERIFGHAVSFKTSDKILSWSFFFGLFLMTAARAKVSSLACAFFFLLMIIPVLIRMQIHFCAG